MEISQNSIAVHHCPQRWQKFVYERYRSSPNLLSLSPARIALFPSVKLCRSAKAVHLHGHYEMSWNTDIKVVAMRGSFPVLGACIIFGPVDRPRILINFKGMKTPAVAVPPPELRVILKTYKKACRYHYL